MSKEITFPEGRSFSSGKVARFSIDMTGVSLSKGTHYTLVYDQSELVPGSVIVFLNASGTMAMGAPSPDGHTRTASDLWEDWRQTNSLNALCPSSRPLPTGPATASRSTWIVRRVSMPPFPSNGIWTTSPPGPSPSS